MPGGGAGAGTAECDKYSPGVSRGVLVVEEGGKRGVTLPLLPLGVLPPVCMHARQRHMCEHVCSPLHQGAHTRASSQRAN